MEESMYRITVVRANEGISFSIFRRGHRSLGLDDGVDAADCVLLAN